MRFECLCMMSRAMCVQRRTPKLYFFSPRAGPIFAALVRQSVAGKRGLDNGLGHKPGIRRRRHGGSDGFHLRNCLVRRADCGQWRSPRPYPNPLAPKMAEAQRPCGVVYVLDLIRRVGRWNKPSACSTSLQDDLGPKAIRAGLDMTPPRTNSSSEVSKMLNRPATSARLTSGEGLAVRAPTWALRRG